MYDITSGQDWLYIRHLLLPQIAEKPWGQALYDLEVARGRARAPQYLRAALYGECVPSRGILRETHATIYGSALNLAGHFRQGAAEESNPNQEQGVPAHRIRSELGHLERITKGLFLAAQTPEQKARVISLYHFECLTRIRPFAVGNGPVLRAIAEHEVRSMLKREPAPVLDREAYLEALLHARKTGDLGPLSYTLTELPLPQTLRQDYRPELKLGLPKIAH